MSWSYCPKCKKERYIERLTLGRVLRLDRTHGCGEVEGLCPKCGLFISRVSVQDIEPNRPKAPKDYRKEFKSRMGKNGVVK